MSNYFDFSGPRRNTKCYWLNLFGVDILISYETPVAFNGFRRHNCWGPTTGRHMKENNVYDWTVIEDETEFDRRLDAAILAGISRNMAAVQSITSVLAVKTLTPELEHELG